jgi:DNA replication protein DnaC
MFDHLPKEQRQCEKHGEYTSTKFLSHWSGCPTCYDEERPAREEAERQKQIEKEKQWQAEINQRKLKNMLGRAAIPERFTDRTLQNYIAENDGQRKALDFATCFVEAYAQGNRGQSMIFTGERGTGKTHLAVGIANELMHKHHAQAVYSTVLRLIRAVRETWRRDSEKSETEVINQFTQPELLILDEVGIQAGSENERNILFDVLNERYENRKSTIMMTNLSVDECRAFLGERVFDRMREDGGRFVAFNWESHRGKQ